MLNLIFLTLLAQQENETREKIDKIIRGCTDAKKKVNLGLLRETIELSIGFGAPAWNGGDHEACARFYVKTAESLTAAFTENIATPPAWAALGVLKAALERARRTEDVDRKAWALRYAFDKIMVEWQAKSEQGSALKALGQQYFGRMNYEEAEDSLQEACAMLDEIAGGELPKGMDAVPVLYGHVLFARGKFKEASRAIDKLIAAQKPDGSIMLASDGGGKFDDPVGDAAVFALVLLLQKEGVFKAEGKKVEWKPAPAKK
jgi:tetratricopeptide (TPR) repeat protein